MQFGKRRTSKKDLEASAEEERLKVRSQHTGSEISYWLCIGREIGVKRRSCPRYNQIQLPDRRGLTIAALCRIKEVGAWSY